MKTDLYSHLQEKKGHIKTIAIEQPHENSTPLLRVVCKSPELAEELKQHVFDYYKADGSSIIIRGHKGKNAKTGFDIERVDASDRANPLGDAIIKMRRRQLEQRPLL